MIKEIKVVIIYNGLLNVLNIGCCKGFFKFIFSELSRENGL